MRDFMQGDRQQQWRRQHDEKLNRIEFLHQAIIRNPFLRGLEKWLGVAQSLAKQLRRITG
jgi:hypothetical protein